MNNKNWLNQSDEYPLNFNQRAEELYQIPDYETDSNGVFEAPAIVVNRITYISQNGHPLFLLTKVQITTPFKKRNIILKPW